MNGINKYICCLSILLSFLLLNLNLIAQERFRVVFYNVENLYDVKDNPLTDDEDFTPNGKLRWTPYRYWQKQHNLARVISSIDEGYPPAIVGLSEVENDLVLYDLIRKTALRKHKYEYIITDSKDLRGSNTALLYQRDQIKILSKKFYTPIIDTLKTTRDILHITGQLVNGCLLDVFVCHFPSRREGIKRSRPYRIKCAALLREKVDSLYEVRKEANVIIMGDFNDYPTDVSLKDILKAGEASVEIFKDDLYNLFYTASRERIKHIGSYKYRGKWNFVDQFIVNGRLLLSESKIYVKNNKAYVYSADFLLNEDSKKYGGFKPFRSYSGWKYLGGFSDHLPIYLDLDILE